MKKLIIFLLLHTTFCFTNSVKTVIQLINAVNAARILCFNENPGENPFKEFDNIATQASQDEIDVFQGIDDLATKYAKAAITQKIYLESPDQKTDETKEKLKKFGENCRILALNFFKKKIKNAKSLDEIYKIMDSLVD